MVQYSCVFCNNLHLGMKKVLTSDDQIHDSNNVVVGKSVVAAVERRVQKISQQVSVDQRRGSSGPDH